MTLSPWSVLPGWDDPTERSSSQVSFCPALCSQGCSRPWTSLKSILDWPCQRRRPRLQPAWQWMSLLRVSGRQGREGMLSTTNFLLPAHQMNQRVKNVWEFREYCLLTGVSQWAFQSHEAFVVTDVNDHLGQYCLNENICALSQLSSCLPFHFGDR